MSFSTTRFGLPLLAPAQAQKHVTVNEALIALDRRLGAGVLSRSVYQEPTNPSEGDAYLMNAGRTGVAWSGFGEYDIAFFDGGIWRSLPPVTGLAIYVADENTIVAFDGARWRAVVAGSNKNALVNGGLRFWRRGETFSNLSGNGAPSYTADRWAYVQSGAANNVIERMTTGLAALPDALKITRPSGVAAPSSVSVLQALESVDAAGYAGQPVVFSFRRNAGVGFGAGAISAEIRVGRGQDESAALLASGGWTGAETIAAASFSPAGDFSSVEYVSGVMPADATQIGVVITWAPTGVAGADDWIAFADLSLERGAEPGFASPPDVANELARCRRYFHKWGFGPNEAPADGISASQQTVLAISPTAARAFLELPTEMRRAPDFKVYRGAFVSPGVANSWNIFNGSWMAASSTTLQVRTTQSIVVEAAGSFTAGYGYRFNGGWTADAEL